MEAVIARGDRRLSRVIKRAWEKGCKYDGWREHFNFQLWQEAFDEEDIDGGFYAQRERNEDELFPWDFIDIGVSKKYLYREYQKSLAGQLTHDCRLACTGCGIRDCSMRGVFN